MVGGAWASGFGSENCELALLREQTRTCARQNAHRAVDQCRYIVLTPHSAALDGERPGVEQSQDQMVTALSERAARAWESPASA